MPLPVSTVDPLATRPLRWEVLRAGVEPVRLDQPLQDDEVPGTVALAVLDPEQGTPIACGLIVPAVVPGELALRAPGARTSWRLRGMAVRAQHRSQGLGSALVAEAISRVARAGGGLFWCHARLAASSLYARAGLVVEGGAFEEPGIGPHLLMWRLVAPTGGAGEG